MSSLYHSHQNHEVIQASGLRHEQLDAANTCNLLTSLGTRFESAVESRDPNQLIGAIDLLRRGSSLLSAVEVWQ